MSGTDGNHKTDKTVLIVTYYFPPSPFMASQRLGGLAKYLPEFGWDAIVLTRELPGGADPRFHVVQTTYPGDASAIVKRKFRLKPDKGFQEQLGVPASVREGKSPVSRKIVKNVKSLIAYPDEQKYWRVAAVEAGDSLLRERRCDALLSSGPPFTVHRIAAELGRKHRIPWVADFRDLWTQSPYYPYLAIRKLFEKRMEVKTIAGASALVSTSDMWAKALNELHRDKRAFAIPNGFDPDIVSTETNLTEDLTITYAGGLYHGRRDPEILFQALSELISEKTIGRRHVNVRFYGPVEYWLEQEIKNHGLEDVVVQNRRVPREVSIAKQRESQILLLLSWDDPRERGTFTGKVFEYMAARRPILGVGGPKGVVSELLEKTGAGTHANEVVRLKEILVQYYREFVETGAVRFRGVDEEVQKYSHREMARKFADVLNWAGGDEKTH